MPKAVVWQNTRTHYGLHARREAGHIAQVLENFYSRHETYMIINKKREAIYDTTSTKRYFICPPSRPQLTSLGCQPRATLGGEEGAPHLFTHAVVMHMLAKRTGAAGVGAGAGGAHERGDGQGRGVVEAPPRPAAKR